MPLYTFPIFPTLNGESVDGQIYPEEQGVCQRKEQIMSSSLYVLQGGEGGQFLWQ